MNSTFDRCKSNEESMHMVKHRFLNVETYFDCDMPIVVAGKSTKSRSYMAECSTPGWSRHMAERQTHHPHCRSTVYIFTISSSLKKMTEAFQQAYRIIDIQQFCVVYFDCLSITSDLIFGFTSVTIVNYLVCMRQGLWNCIWPAPGV
jgi:hypothetical protein